MAPEALPMHIATADTSVMGSSENPKTALTVFLQRYLTRTLTKGDVVYMASACPSGLFKSKVLVVPLSQEFIGDPQPSQKAAEAAAAQQALRGFSTQIASLPPPDSKLLENQERRRMKKEQVLKTPSTVTNVAPTRFKSESLPTRPASLLEGAAAGRPVNTDAKANLASAVETCIQRTVVTGLDIVYSLVGHHPSKGMFTCKVTLACLDGMETLGRFGKTRLEGEQNAAVAALQCLESMPNVVAMHSMGFNEQLTSHPPQAPNNKKRRSAASSDAPIDSDNPAKVTLQYFLQRFLSRTLTKQDIRYEVWAVDEAWQASVSLPCLESMENTHLSKGCLFQGKLASNEKAAGHSAAQAVLDAYAPEIEAMGPLCKKHRSGHVQAPTEGRVCVVQAPWLTQTSEEEREFVLTSVTGEVVEWDERNGKGWILPHWPVEHEKAATHGGKIFVALLDLLEATRLPMASTVQFNIYAASNCLGASGVIIL